MDEVGLYVPVVPAVFTTQVPPPGLTQTGATQTITLLPVG